MTNITDVTCTMAGNQPSFSVTWNNDCGNSSKPQLNDPNNNVVSATNVGVEWSNSVSPATESWSAAASLNATEVYSMFIVQGGGDGTVFSSGVPVLYTTATVTSATFDGTSVTVDWDPPESSPHPGRNENRAQQRIESPNGEYLRSRQCDLYREW
ncbi:hypothetical protein SCOR_34595 [Sulfidibacter corallicola]|uniref:Uncharacterized protein n=1 Tax=Sulfidibacter corallicola TaxID=2818388 RepID=A0A8A4TS13_SULCO|nr:hypothetical protein [Sulfidibacter corallicola]QTD49335.1 hypothetical protein J3U87_27435 [Sulfidibacter corallicola]